MTLCKYRPQRTYDAQFILEKNDVNGLLKKMDEAVAAHGEDGDLSTAYYVGGLIALSTLFKTTERVGEIDMWTDFMELFAANLESW